MSIKIGHSSIDENNKTIGGTAGDQTEKEVCIRSWYSKPWQLVLRCKDSAKAELMASACEKSKVTSIAKTYVNTCKSLGYTCHIYSNLDWYKNKYNASELSALGCKFWIARYSSSDDGTIKESLKPNVGEYIWQYSSNNNPF